MSQIIQIVIRTLSLVKHTVVIPVRGVFLMQSRACSLRLVSGLFLLLWLSPTLHASADVLTFSTGDFVPSEWSSHILSASTGTSVAFTEASGGNPGAYRRVSLTVDPFESVLNSQLWSVAQFTPAIQGPIASVSLAYDISRVFTSRPDATQVAKGISVRQDGVIYISFTGVSTVSPPTWETVAVADLVPLFPAVNWMNGNTITFGLFDSVSTTSAGFTIDGGYDNYRVTINFVPRDDQCEQDLAAAQQQIENLQNQNLQLQGQLLTANTTINSLNQTIAQLQTQLSAANAAVLNLQGQVTTLTSQNQTLTTQNQTLTSQNQALTQQNTQLQTQLADGLIRVQNDLRVVFNNPTFVIPGATLLEQYRNVINAILDLNKGRKMGIYTNLGGVP